jgi:hypothetical protein
VSTSFSPANVLAMLLFAAALAWRIYQLQRDPRSVPLWAVTVTIACLAASFLCQQKAIAEAIDSASTPGASRFVINVLLSSAICSLVIFFLGSTIEPRRYQRVVLEIVPLAVTVVLMGVALAITPVESRGDALGPELVHVPGVALFYLGAGLYLCYGLIACTGWIVRYLATADRNLRIGLRLGAIGLGCAAVGSILRAVYIVLAWTGASPGFLLSAAVPFVILGLVLFLVGITYPGASARVSALRRRRRHRRRHRELGPLWTLLAKAYPDLILRTAPVRRLDTFRPRTIHRRYYRRVIEIRDGLVQLSPYLATDLTTLADNDPRGAAAELESALARQAAGEDTDHRAHLVLPAEGAGDLEADVEPLLVLARAVGTAK